MSLSGQVGTLATRIGTEFKTIRSTFVPNSLRGPIGGVSASTGVTGAVTIDPVLSNHRRLTATGDVTINLMTGGGDGQRILFEVNASGGQRVVTFDPGYELSSAVPVRSFTIPSGNWAYIAAIYRSGTWRLTSAEPQVSPDYSTPSAWVPADHGLIAWSNDPVTATGTINNGTGILISAAIKVSTSAVCTGISYQIVTAGSGFTANRNYIGLYDAGGTLLAQTVDQATTWATSGTRTSTWVSSVTLAPGTYYVGVINTSSSAVFFAATTTGNGATFKGRSANGYRGGVTTTTYTTLPATRPTPTSNNSITWFGLL